MTPVSLISLDLAQSGDLAIIFNIWCWAVLGGGALATLAVKAIINKSLSWTTDIELNIPLAGIGSVKITPNREVVQIAHKAWTEIITRKVGLKFDKNDDVLVEVYDSWHEIFSELRSLIRDIPASQLKNENTKKLVDTLIKVLNLGLRPHLTKYQAKFRRWYEKQIINKKITLSPQEIQKKYPGYDDLVDDLLKINEQLVAYAVELKKLV